MSRSVERLNFHGEGGSLFGLYIVNGLLTIITFGIYSFWARAKMRQYFYTSTELAGDRFSFHGTGGELLKGWLIGVAALFGLGIVMAIVLPLVGGTTPGTTPGIGAILVICAYFASLMVLVCIAINGARRYRLSRSSWRGVRFSFLGKWKEFLALSVKGTLLTALTMGFYSAHYRNQGREFLVTNARFGTMHFSYDGKGSDLFGRWALALLLALPTLGLSLIWYRALEHRYFWSRTTIGPARFRSTMTFGGLLQAILLNLLLIVVTFGIGSAWAITNWARFLTQTTELEGEIAWGEIEQQFQVSSSLAEGLAQGLDVGVDLGLGM